MSSITVKDGTEIYYKDWGTGQPIMFHHGWPLSADDWDSQMLFFRLHGYRVLAHDRRGHGRSTQTDLGNDMDTYAADSAALEWRTCRAYINLGLGLSPLPQGRDNAPFIRSITHAPDQTYIRLQHLHCHFDLATPSRSGL
jgi:hypothetical protein